MPSWRVFGNTARRRGTVAVAHGSCGFSPCSAGTPHAILSEKRAKREAFDDGMKALDKAGKDMADLLRRTPYRKGSAVMTWTAIIEQRAEDKHRHAFSWMYAVKKVVTVYAATLSVEEQMAIWKETGDARTFPGDPLPEALPKLLYPWLWRAIDRPLHRAVGRRLAGKAEAEDGLDS